MFVTLLVICCNHSDLTSHERMETFHSCGILSCPLACQEGFAVWCHSRGGFAVSVSVRRSSPEVEARDLVISASPLSAGLPVCVTIHVLRLVVHILVHPKQDEFNRRPHRRRSPRQLAGDAGICPHWRRRQDIAPFSLG